MQTTKRPAKFNLNAQEETTVTQALQMARRQFRTDRDEFNKLADFLQAGGEHPMFAHGENGVRAAKRLAEQFERQAQDCANLLMALDLDLTDEDFEES